MAETPRPKRDPPAIRPRPTTSPRFAPRAAGDRTSPRNGSRTSTRLTLRERLRPSAIAAAASASSVRAHERLFLETPADVFGHVLTFWQSDRDP
ncbi:hypothetical protein JL722_9252 [Aureococcus anophagefferens]|nr:hypothetical protein JL722_9252 [Aureococcus anophagefferens]